jgi:hypothetical protein
MRKVIPPYFSWLIFLVEVGIPSSNRVVDWPCEERWELSFLWFVCVTTLRLRGEKSTPSVGWEVPMRSQRLEGGSEEERQPPKTSTSQYRLQYSCLRCYLYYYRWKETILYTYTHGTTIDLVIDLYFHVNTAHCKFYRLHKFCLVL